MTTRERTKRNGKPILDVDFEEHDDELTEVTFDFNPEYDPYYHPDVVIQEMQRGASVEELPLYLGVLPSVVVEWFHKHKEFQEACVEGAMLALAWWKIRGRLGVDDKRFNTNQYKTEMQNRFGYVASKKAKVDDLKDPRFLVEAIEENMIDVKNMSIEQLNEELEKIEETDELRVKRTRTN